MTYKFTNSAQNVLEIAKEIAIELGHNYIGTEHILYGLTEEENGVASKVLENQNINSENVLEEIENLIGRDEGRTITSLGFTPRTKRVLENAFLEARKLDSDYIGTEHILIGIMREADSIAVRIEIYEKSLLNILLLEFSSIIDSIAIFKNSELDDMA